MPTPACLHRYTSGISDSSVLPAAGELAAAYQFQKPQPGAGEIRKGDFGNSAGPLPSRSKTAV
jgi:hypothetical protein